ncbi:MAG: hypothetical protein ACJA2N_001655 [Salibacteraceae bacterium]|jgi:hypothetical protein
MKLIQMFPLMIGLILITSFSCEKKCNMGSNCELKPNAGRCKAYMPKYYFDEEDGECKEFIWGGCEGTVPFETLKECKECECNT